MPKILNSNGGSRILLSWRGGQFITVRYSELYEMKKVWYLDGSRGVQTITPKSLNKLVNRFLDCFVLGANLAINILTKQ